MDVTWVSGGWGSGGATAGIGWWVGSVACAVLYAIKSQLWLASVQLISGWPYSAVFCHASASYHTDIITVA